MSKQRERRFISTADIAEITIENGFLAGYLVKFGVPHASTGDVVLRGAFAKTLTENLAKGGYPLMARHFGDFEGTDTEAVIGSIRKAHEDEVGLWVEAEFAKTPRAQNVRQLVADGHIRGLSIGGYVMQQSDARNSSGGYDITEFKLAEGTVTPFPAISGSEIRLAASETAVVEQPAVEQPVVETAPEAAPDAQTAELSTAASTADTAKAAADAAAKRTAAAYALRLRYTCATKGAPAA